MVQNSLALSLGLMQLRMDKGKYEYMAVQRWTRKKIKYKLAKCDKVSNRAQVPYHAPAQEEYACQSAGLLPSGE